MKHWRQEIIGQAKFLTLLDNEGILEICDRNGHHFVISEASERIVRVCGRTME